MDKRSTLAILLSFLIFVGWMWLQNKIWPPQKPPTPASPTAQAPPAPLAPAKSEPGKPPAEPAPPPGEAAHYPVHDPITLTSKNLEVVLTNKGAGIERLTLLEYPKAPKRVEILDAIDPRWPHLAVRQVGGPDAIESLPWEVTEQKPDKAEFRYRLRNGVEITKILSLDPDRHTLQMTLMLDNKNPKVEGKGVPEQKVKLEILAFSGIDLDSTYRYEQYLMGVYHYDHQLKMKSMTELETGEKKMAEALAMPAGPARDAAVKDVDDKYFKLTAGHLEWFGVRNRFFTALLMPDGAALDNLNYAYYRDLPIQFQRLEAERFAERHQLPASVAATPLHNVLASAFMNELAVGEGRKIFQFTAIASPLEKEPLRELPGAEDLGGYTGGCFLGFVVKPAAAVILEILGITSKVVGNMGFAVILTTLLIRLCLFPLSLKSQRNAMQMQALAPKIQALKERYKDDQQKYGVEQMRLFKEHGVNPVAGCLPLFIQMPIFIGMYSVFEMSVMLRHAPFILWIKDLSEPDRLLGGHWGIHVPLPILPDIHLEALNLLPIVMTITWFLQAYWSPRSPDPQMAQQQKMMMWMPIVFGFSCYGLASGLSLYFLSNSLLSMAEQKIIKKYILKIGPDGKPLAPVLPENGRK